MDKRLFQLQADLCKTLANPTRLHILCLLRGGEKSFADLQAATGLSKANLSQHLGVLRARGVVSARRDGQHLYLSVANRKILRACEIMHEVLCERIAAESKAASPVGA